jgi:outer membrane protein OmpA-like peptidoglycan-associated protein
MWLREISHRATDAKACLEITGHTSPTGPEPINERLSQLRSDCIKQRLAADAPSISPRIIVTGMGSRENFVGTGNDDMSDAIDRTIPFSVIPCQ